MLDWKNQSIDLLNQGDFQIVEPGPLHVPIEGFAIRRDENLALTLETKAARTAKSRAVQHLTGMVTLNTEQVELANISGIKAVLSGVQTRSVSTLQDGLKEIAGIHHGELAMTGAALA